MKASRIALMVLNILENLSDQEILDSDSLGEVLELKDQAMEGAEKDE